MKYRSIFGKGESWEEVRVCFGVVTRIYQKHDDLFDDDGEFLRSGPLLQPSEWHAAIKVDRPLPKWWGYGDHDQFAPPIGDLQPET